MVSLANIKLFSELNDVYVQTGKKYLTETEEHYVWLNEVVPAAQAAINGGKMTLLPKTPSEKIKAKSRIKKDMKRRSTRSSFVSNRIMPALLMDAVDTAQPNLRKSYVLLKDIDVQQAGTSSNAVSEPDPVERRQSRRSSTAKARTSIRKRFSRSLFCGTEKDVLMEITDALTNVEKPDNEVGSSASAVSANMDGADRRSSLRKRTWVLSDTDTCESSLPKIQRGSGSRKISVDNLIEKQDDILSQTVDPVVEEIVAAAAEDEVQNKPEEVALQDTAANHSLGEIAEIPKDGPRGDADIEHLPEASVSEKRTTRSASKRLSSAKQLSLEVPEQINDEPLRTRTPNYTQSTSHFVTPVKQSGLRQPGWIASPASSKKYATPSRTLPTNVTSFIRRNTPQKMTDKEKENALKEKSKIQEQRLLEASAKRDLRLKQKAEEQKKKREERAQKVIITREMQLRTQAMELRKKLEEKQLSAAATTGHQKIRFKQYTRLPASEVKPRRSDKGTRSQQQTVAAVPTGDHQTKIPESRLFKDPRLPPAVKDAVTLNKTYSMEDHSSSTAPKQNTPVSVVSTANNYTGIRDVPINTSAVQQSANTSIGDSYEITPLRKHKPSTNNDYNIEDIRSSDETDDEEHPRKRIPFWAQGPQLKSALINQYYSSTDPENVFGYVDLHHIEDILKFRKHRTSSAQWSPIVNN